MSCCGGKKPVTLPKSGTPCPKCGRFVSASPTTVRCPVCRTFFLPMRT